MKTKTNRLLSLLLTLTMVLGMLPAMSLTAFAAERVPRWQLLAYLDNPCKEKPTPRP